MTHLTEEEMIGQVYGEGENTAAVERHLEGCSKCAAAFAELQRDLAEMDRIGAPVRDAQYGERVWAAIADSLPVYAAEKRRWWNAGLWSGGFVKGLGFAAACAGLLACAFYAGRVWEQQKQPHTAIVKQAPAPQAKQPIVVVVLDDHLDRSERFLVQ
jgi:anti-sigma factor RsiW